MLDHCPVCADLLRRLTPAQTAFYRLPFAAAEWRLLGHGVEGRRCDVCTTLYLLPTGRPRLETCPRCQRLALRLERAELLPPTLLDEGREVIRLGCACGYREVVEETRPVPRPPEPGTSPGSVRARVVGFGLDW